MSIALKSFPFGSATAMAAALRGGKVSSVDLLKAHLERVDRFNTGLNALVVDDRKAAMNRARAADRARAKGEIWGPLHGLPMTVKESFDLPGLPTTWGYEAQRGNIARQPAAAVQRLLEAGAVIYGKTNVPVAMADWQTFNPVYGTTNNPWDVTRTPGGSSGGSAAALAAGLTALELGSDIGASIRNPAHYCGVWGHKPTWGVVPQQGQQLPGMECVDTIDIGVAGQLARSAHDLTLAMDVLSTPLRSFGPLGWQPVAWRDAGLPATRLRVAVMADDALAEVDASVRGAIESLVRFLRDRGVAVDERSRPVDSVEAWTTYVPLVRAALIGGISDDEHRQAVIEAAKWPEGSLEFPALHWRGRSLSHRDWLRLEEVRSKLRRQWAAFFERFDLLICPVATTPAFKHNQQGWRWERMIAVNGREQPSTASLFWAGYTNLCGLPATAVPLGLSDDGLPIGAQICGPAFADPVCLRFARWLETEYRAFVPPPMAA
jgi:amidase